ncbi:MAG TPA: peptide chain release factor 2, partial [Armatimonadota bacterium]|nr:peptide chain release factor 2 [Armatimonadota bacterium]
MVDLSELRIQANSLQEEIISLYTRLNIPSREARLKEVEIRAEDPHLWDDPDTAQQVMAEVARRRNELQPLRRMVSLAEDTVLLAEMADEAGDTDSADEIKANIADLQENLVRLQTEALFADQFDASNAIVEINAGAGGTEACDWAAMLGRMYLRWCERHGFQADVIDSLPGDEAGVKSMTIEVQGTNAYGYLKSERGTHRLIRFSPFNAQNLRQTSFSSVGVIPDVEEDVDIDIRDEDIKVDTYRSSGAGGQHVNKTESAIRITHLASGIVVTCQNERSQIKNRASAMRVLKARLLDRQRKEQEAAMAKIRGVQTEIAFGSQIRTYWLQPYTLVKDHRTEFETGNASAVLDGD